MKQIGALVLAYAAFGRVKTRPIAILKAEVTRCDGQLVDPKTGVILAPDEAYETVYEAVKEEPLGTIVYEDVA